jgi:hypothetical protein
MVSEASARSLAMLRDTSHVSWMVIPMLLVVLYVYFQEIDRGHYARVLAGLAFWGMDWFNEIWNGLVFHFSGHAPVWGIAGDTSLLLLMGLNIEITFMFAITGVLATLGLPHDKTRAWWGINNRWWYAAGFSALSVGVEMLLHRAGLLVWDWPWWGESAPWGIFLLGYLPFYVVCYWVYDMDSLGRQVRTVTSLFAALLAALWVFGVGLGWL